MSRTRVTNVDGEIIALTKDGVRTFLLPDPQGNVVGEIDSAQKVVNRTTYWPFGEVRTGTGYPFGFVGTLGYHRHRHAGSFWTDPRAYVRARWLHAPLARWLTPDPLWPMERPYAYVNGNPTTWVDPLGLEGRDSSFPDFRDPAYQHRACLTVAMPIDFITKRAPLPPPFFWMKFFTWTLEGQMCMRCMECACPTSCAAQSCHSTSFLLRGSLGTQDSAISLSWRDLIPLITSRRDQQVLTQLVNALTFVLVGGVQCSYPTRECIPKSDTVSVSLGARACLTGFEAWARMRLSYGFVCGGSAGGAFDARWGFRLSNCGFINISITLGFEYERCQ